ncbi:MAG TPA: flavin reductase family protein [Casimicrobiaceae bacterium]|nr:flavin reductase family protein [Casimicrobiaceae bacterium]
MPSRSPNSARPPPPFTERQLRDALAQFATGITVICARARHGGYAGFTANSFNALSLDPPLVLWSLHCNATSLGSFQHAERYTVNVLAHDQVALARRFSEPHEDRFAGVKYRLGLADAPLIEDCVAWLECRHYAQQRMGDHVLFVGEVEYCERRPGVGLVFVHGRYAMPQELS